jgi:hypothetical protein
MLNVGGGEPGGVPRKRDCLVVPADERKSSPGRPAGRYRRSMWRLVLVSAGALALPAAPRSGGGTTGAELAFARGGNIRTIGADGRRARLLIRDVHSPAWSPDGSRIAFVSSRSGDEEIYVARANGRGIERLTRSPGPDLSPAWSRSGHRIAWSRAREIWTMTAFGSDRRAVVRRTLSNFNGELFRTPATRLTFTKGSEGVLGDDGMPDGTGLRRLTRGTDADWRSSS